MNNVEDRFKTKILVITVTYHPDVIKVTKQITTLLNEKDNNFLVDVLVIDNGSNIGEVKRLNSELQTLQNVSFQKLSENIGLAAAQNIGIQYAKLHGFSHVLLMDQDSQPSRGMLKSLVNSWKFLEKTEEKLAAVGPNYKDKILNNPPDFVRIKFWGAQRQFPSEGVNQVSVDYLIASGSLIGVDALESIGLMCESLFIDYVDIEWGLRANRLGWSLWGDFNSEMQHSLGEKVANVFGRRIPIHNSVRNYFVVRNAIFLSRKTMLPKSWRVSNLIRLVPRLLLYLIFGDNRITRVKMIWLGLRDGVFNQMGKPSWFI